MIFLTKGQTLYDNPGMVTYDPTGYYEDGDSVICAVAAFPEEPVCRYEAKFIAYGNMVYNITDPDALLEEVKKISPDTLFGKTNADKVASDIVENIQMADAQNPTTENVDVTPPENASSTPTIDVPNEPSNPVDVSTTTPTTPITTDTVDTTTAPTISDVEQVINDLNNTSNIPEVIPDTSVVPDTSAVVDTGTTATTTP